jgi:DNA primase
VIDKISYILSKLDGEFNASGRLHCTCPFHDDTTRSFSINEEGLWICGSTSCGLRGNFPLFYKLIEGLSWPEVFEKLEGKRLAPDLSKYLKKEKQTLDLKVNDFPTSPYIEPIKSIKYLHDRNLGKDVQYYYSLYYGVDGKFSGISIENTIVCPIFDLDGTYRTFQVRYLSENSYKRWLNPAGSPNQDLLYGGWLINNLSDTLWLVEGASDVWNLFTNGIQSVGLFTKEASAGQLNRIHQLCSQHNLTPVVCLDGDVDKKSILVLTNELEAFSLRPKVVYLNQDEDPGSLTPERIKEVEHIYRIR